METIYSMGASASAKAAAKAKADKYVTTKGAKPTTAKKALPAAVKGDKPVYDGNREKWLQAATAAVDKWFFDLGYPLPATRVSVGFTSKGARSNRIGECWDGKMSADGSYQIFIHPQESDSLKVFGILVHELIHAAVGLKAKHGRKFGDVGRALGFEGKAAQMHKGAAFEEAAKPILAKLGPIPHARLKPGESTTGKKQPTRMIKCECPKCGYLARTTPKWIEAGGKPICPVHMIRMK